MPSNAADAAGLLQTAIADPNPVVFVENKSLYFRRETVPDPPPPVPIGQATTLREGRDVTIVALSRLVGDALEAADRLASDDGIEAEVIDPRTLVPLDLDTLARSVRRTGRAVVAHEAVTAGGFGAELAAQLQAAAFDYLEAPIQRVGAPYTPVPVSPPLEDAYRPGARRRSYRGRARSRSNGASTTSSRGSTERSRRRSAPSGRLELGRSSASSDAPGICSSSPRWLSTISRFVSDRRACSRATLSAREPSRSAIASTSHRCWRWATTRISRDSGSWACWSTSALGVANGSDRTASSVRSSSGLRAIFDQTRVEASR